MLAGREPARSRHTFPRTVHLNCTPRREAPNKQNQPPKTPQPLLVIYKKKTKPECKLPKPKEFCSRRSAKPAPPPPGGKGQRGGKGGMSVLAPRKAEGAGEEEETLTG